MFLSQQKQGIKISSPLAITAFYYASFISLGMVTAVIGPTLSKLAARTGVPLNMVSLVFTALSLGYLLGALYSGRLIDRRSGHPLMAAALVAAALLLALTPTMPLLALLALMFFGVGLSQAFIDVGGNTLLVWLHGEKVAPYMNGLHLFYGVGTILSPLLVAQVTTLTDQFAWSYWLISLVMIPIALFLIRAPSPGAPHRQAGAAPERPASWSLIVLFVLFYLTLVGAEGAYGHWIYNYGVATGIATATTAAYLTSTYWGAFTVSRLISIPLAMRFKPLTLLIVDLVGCLIALGLAVFGGGSAPAIWLATILFGAANATIFPLGLTYAGEFITVTGRFTSMIFVGASLGGMIVPWLIGQFFEPAGPGSAMVIMLLDMLLCVGFFVMLNWFRKKTI